MTVTKIILSFIAVVLVFAGGVFVLQGLNVLQGSAMTGDMNWTYRGGGFALAGLAVLAWTLRGAGVLRGLVGLIGVVLFCVGAIWILQGVNVLPGSFMTGHIEWARRGAGAAVIGAIFAITMALKPGAGRHIFGAFGVILLLLGVVWILQGVNVLPGSFMTGHIEWAYRGGAVAAVGAVLLLLTRASAEKASAS